MKPSPTLVFHANEGDKYWTKMKMYSAQLALCTLRWIAHPADCPAPSKVSCAERMERGDCLNKEECPCTNKFICIHSSFYTFLAPLYSKMTTSCQNTQQYPVLGSCKQRHKQENMALQIPGRIQGAILEDIYKRQKQGYSTMLQSYHRLLHRNRSHL
jgi:hypothetical protein